MSAIRDEKARIVDLEIADSENPNEIKKKLIKDCKFKVLCPIK